MMNSKVEKAAKCNELDKLKASDLKCFLKENGLKSTGEKMMLIWRITAFIECQELLIDGVNPIQLKAGKLRKACAKRGLSCIGNDDEMQELLYKYQKENVIIPHGDRTESSSTDDKLKAAIALAKKVIKLSEEGNYEGVLSLTGRKIKSTSSTAEMRKAYLRTSLIIHPDKLKGFSQATKAFQLLVVAFDRLSQPEIYEMKETKKKQKTIKRSNEGCFRTVIRCPRCKAKWGMPLSGLPDYYYNIFMQALKSYYLRLMINLIALVCCQVLLRL